MPSALQFQAPQNATFAFFLQLRAAALGGGIETSKSLNCRKNAPKMRFENALPPDGPFPKCKNTAKKCEHMRQHCENTANTEMQNNTKQMRNKRRKHAEMHSFCVFFLHFLAPWFRVVFSECSTQFLVLIFFCIFRSHFFLKCMFMLHVFRMFFAFLTFQTSKYLCLPCRAEYYSLSVLSSRIW